MDVIRIGVAGAGKMGTYHCFKLKQMKDIEFVGLYDKDEEKAEKIGSMLNVHPFKSYQDLLENVDAIVIAAPTKCHFTLLEEAVLVQKHVFVEKPVIASIFEANKLRELLKGRDTIIQVGHIERFNPAVQQLGCFIDHDKVISIEAKRFGLSNRIQDSDVVLDVMIHDLDIVLSLVKSPIHRIAADGICLSRKGYYDIVTAILFFENGVMATLTASNVSHEKVRTLTLLEEDKVIKTDYLARRQEIVKSGLDTDIDSVFSIVAVPIADPLVEELKHFIDCIKFNKRPIIGIEEGIAAVEAALAIKELLDNK